MNGSGLVQEDQSSLDETDDSSMPSSLAQLPLYSRLKQTSIIRRNIRELRTAQQAKESLVKIQSVTELVGESNKCCESTASHFKALKDLSSFLERTLRNPIIESSLPLSQDVHSGAVQMLKDCLWLHQQKSWRPTDHKVDWHKFLISLKEDVKHWENVSKLMKQRLHDLQVLQQDMDRLCKNTRAL